MKIQFTFFTIIITSCIGISQNSLSDFIALKKQFLENNGDWLTTHAAYTANDTNAIKYFGYSFSEGIHPNELLLSIKGYTPYLATWTALWNGKYIWNAKTKKIEYYATNNAGSIAKGFASQITSSSIDLLFETIDPQGHVIPYKDQHTYSNGVITSTSFTKEKKKWKANKSNTWTPIPRPQGTLAFMCRRDDNFEVYTMDAQGNNLKNLTCNKGTDYAFTYSPDGKKIMFYTNRDKNEEIYLMNADGSNPVNITNHPASDRVHAFSPDGSKIVFVSNRDHAQGELYMMDTAGTSITRLTFNELFEDAPSFSTDGQQILFSRDTKDTIDGKTVSNGEIFLLNLQTKNEKRLTHRPGWDGGATFSPDGKSIAFYGTTADKNYEIFIMNTEGTMIENITNDRLEDYSPSWSPDGKWIAYTNGNAQNYDVWIMHLESRLKYRLTTQPKRDESPFWKPN